MKAQLGWLREMVDLPEEPAEVGRRLTSLGFALDGLDGSGSEAVMDLDVGSNRPDAMSHAGLARELATALGRELRLPRSLPDESATATDSVTSVTIEALDLCPRYAARVVKGLRVGPSPAWMAARLEACGIRPINVVVDVTNYVLLELGHPLHAFDLDRLDGRRIVVRRASKGETMASLDGVERVFEGDELLIADAARAVAIAGVMGGADSEIRDTTRDILIESAWFDPSSVRRTSRRLGLHTEASHRFERGADIDAVPRALDRCAALIAELAGGEVLAGALDEGGALPAPREIRLRRARIRLLCGVDVPDASVTRILEGLGFAILSTDVETDGEPDSGGWLVRAPRSRGDVSREVDLIEEVLRHHGYESVPATLPAFRQGASPRQPWEEGLAALRRTLAASGHHQAVNFSFDDPQAMLAWGNSIVSDGASRIIPLANPMAENLGAMRVSLIPGLLKTASLAARRGEANARLFEDGRVYLRRKQAGESPAEERWAVALVAMGAAGPAHFQHHPPPADVLALKGAVIEALVAAGAKREDISIVAAGVPRCAPGAADVRLAGLRVGWLGRVHPDELAALEIDAPLHAAEIDLTSVLPSAERRRPFVPPSRFPRVTRDVSVLVDRNRNYGAIIASIQALPMGENDAPVESVELIDRYLGAGVPEGKVSLTFSVSYRSPDRTLTQDEVDKRHERLVDALVRGVGAALRT